MMQIATRVDDELGAEFKSVAKGLGVTPADAMRMFVVAFTAHRGFPYEVVLPKAAPFETKAEEDEFFDGLSDRRRERLRVEAAPGRGRAERCVRPIRFGPDVHGDVEGSRRRAASCPHCAVGGQRPRRPLVGNGRQGRRHPEAQTWREDWGAFRR